MTDLLSVWSQADLFLANGGTTVTIANPTEEQLADYVLQLKEKQELNTDPLLNQSFSIAFYGFSEAIKNIYTNPVLIIALDNQGFCSGLIFYYSADFNNEEFLWAEAWSEIDNSGCGNLLAFLFGCDAGKNDKSIQWNPAPAFKGIDPGSRYGVEGYKDTDTRWHVLTKQQMLAMVDSQKDLVAQTKYFSKVFQEELSWYFNPVKYTIKYPSN